MALALPYFIFLGIVMLIFSQYHDDRGRFRDKYNIIPVVLTTLCMILFAGLRDETVGTDTMAYVRKFTQLSFFTPEKDTYKFLKSEPGYYLVQKIAAMFSENYCALLCTIATICYAIVMKAVLRFSDNKLLSLFIYITLGYYTFCFNAARQAIALSIYLLAIPAIINKQFIRYAVIVLIAALFHKSVLIALPLYFIFRMRYTWKSVVVIIFVGVITAQLLPYLLETAKDVDDRYKLYADSEAVGGYLLTTFYVLLAIFCIFMRRMVFQEDLRNYDVFLQMLICGSVIYLVVSLTGSYVELTRFAAYFQISTIFLFPLLFKNRSNPHRNLTLGLFVCGCLIFFNIYISSMAALIPYTLNETL